MSKIGKVIGLALLFAAFLGVVAPGHASPPRGDVFSYELKPTERPRSAGPVDMAFSFAPLGRFCEGCSELRVTVITDGGLEFLGENSWTVQADKDHPYSTILHVNVPRDDTCSLNVRMQCCHIKQTTGCYFVTVGDSIEYWTGNPRGYHPSPPSSKTNHPIRDTLTEEHLQTEYEIEMDLSDPTHLRIAERILGPLPDSSIYDRRRGYYRLWISLRNIIKLADQQLRIEFATPPPWDHRYRPSKDSVPQLPPKDSAKPQGGLDSKLIPNSPDGISLDYVDGLSPSGELQADREITFCLRLNNNTSDYIIGSTNGFRVYSPDGAQWEQITYDTAAATKIETSAVSIQ
ncbi:MAG: hypothetical protein DRP47_08840 [Candidatus Zixiibacteriota bacterium]|nr:MAG: hypothetical protein DRP47_08840 [candidate division Zixibacteria bacterium]